MVDISVLTAQLLTVSGLVKVIVELLKLYVPKLVKQELSSEGKFIASLGVAVIITLTTGISIFETENTSLFYLGAVGAGFIAGLGSNFIHEFMKVLQTVKSLKK